MGVVPALIYKYSKSTEAMLTFELIITWLVTILIIWKLYRVGHRAMNLTGHKSNKYLRIILALVESGMLLSVYLSLFVGLWYAELRSITDLLAPSLTRVTGMVPMMIMLKLGLGYEQPADSVNRTTPRPARSPARELPARRPVRRDSLSIDISTFQISGIQSSPDPGETPAAKEAKSWTKLKANTPWKTVGGGDVADLHYWSGGDIDLEQGEEKRRRSSEF